MVDKSIKLILLVLLLSSMIYGLASPILPKIIQSKGITLSWTGVIFAAYVISYMLMAPIISANIDSFGHAKVMASGVLLMALSITSFGLINIIDTNSIIISFAIVLRLC